MSAASSPGPRAPRPGDPDAGPAVVVGVAIVVDGRVLVARRTAPAALAGGWELPGGKVEPGEDPAATAVREIQEELGCTVAVTGWLTTESAIGSRWVLRAALARLLDGAPAPSEHDQVRWLTADELDDLPWLPADRPLLPELARRLRSADATRTP